MEESKEMVSMTQEDYLVETLSSLSKVNADDLVAAVLEKHTEGK